jgi:hypothetical protein
MPINKEEIQKLSLRERIKKLKEIEEDNKKEIDEARKLIKETENQLKSDSVAEAVSPPAEEVDISKLFGEEGSSLEQTTEETGPKFDEVSIKYQLAEDYETLKGIMYGGNVDDNIIAKVDAIGDRLDKITRYMTDGTDISRMAVASREVISKVKEYHGG